MFNFKFSKLLKSKKVNILFYKKEDSKIPKYILPYKIIQKSFFSN